MSGQRKSLGPTVLIRQAPVWLLCNFILFYFFQLEPALCFSMRKYFQTGKEAILLYCEADLSRSLP